MSDNIPDGFRMLRDVGGQFINVNGPLYFRKTDSGLLLGLRIEERHCNPMGICHGGMLMTFCDMVMPMAANYANKLAQFLPTISMTTDFVGPAKLGAWLEGRTDVLKVTRNLVFTQAIITADGEPAVRASGTFKRGATQADLAKRQQG